jgi:hypothetical protein
VNEKKNQTNSCASRRLILLYHSEGTWITVCYTDELVSDHLVPLHSLYSMVAMMIRLQILTENVLVTTKLRPSTAQPTSDLHL